VEEELNKPPLQPSIAPKETCMLHLFIDSNVYLNCYHYSGDDLRELKKLSLAITQGQIKLYITQQVIDEFTRNRESKISDALHQFRDKPVPREFPQIVKNTPEYKDMQKIALNYSSKMKEVDERLESDIATKTTAADKAIYSIFESAIKIEITSQILKAAKLRSDLGNPPGKKGSLGDAINWESLLPVQSGLDQFFIVSSDKDFASDYDGVKISQFLDEEWHKNHTSDITLYERLSEFFKDRFPDINLAEDFEKQLAIQSLVNSTNFAVTHRSISKLNHYADFSDDEIKELVTAAINNTQIFWVVNDQAVKNFYKRITNNKLSVLDSEQLAAFNQLFAAKKQTEDVIDLSDLF
jgi:hypothetical protein